MHAPQSRAAGQSGTWTLDWMARNAPPTREMLLMDLTPYLADEHHARAYHREIILLTLLLWAGFVLAALALLPV